MRAFINSFVSFFAGLNQRSIISSNGLINSLVKTGSSYIKMMMETLLKGETIDVPIDEQIVFSQLDYSEDAVWSLMLASGYLKVISSDKLTGDRTKSVMYKLALTNFEIKLMFELESAQYVL